MEIQVKNKYFYFGKTEAEAVEGWEPGWAYRFVIHTDHETVTLERPNGEHTVLHFTAVNELTNVVQKVQNEIITSVVGALNQNA